MNTFRADNQLGTAQPSHQGLPAAATQNGLPNISSISDESDWISEIDQLGAGRQYKYKATNTIRPCQ